MMEENLDELRFTSYDLQMSHTEIALIHQGEERSYTRLNLY